ncbi:hypothetical protein HLB44_34865 [Aquincola sp. S2]|uniref:Type III effector protein n=1 Tax=Pseudaquabacterium terrae TaxID=2732868 RepID=A0ABX2EUG2_9BURK|nr:hypothetical protein [Aquabacterium terrae]NRF72179.1 hypothetical protein [Aquabacterium terrae]
MKFRPLTNVVRQTLGRQNDRNDRNANRQAPQGPHAENLPLQPLNPRRNDGAAPPRLVLPEVGGADIGFDVNDHLDQARTNFAAQLNVGAPPVVPQFTPIDILAPHDIGMLQVLRPMVYRDDLPAVLHRELMEGRVHAMTAVAKEELLRTAAARIGDATVDLSARGDMLQQLLAQRDQLAAPERQALTQLITANPHVLARALSDRAQAHFDDVGDNGLSLALQSLDHALAHPDPAMRMQLPGQAVDAIFAAIPDDLLPTVVTGIEEHTSELMEQALMTQAPNLLIATQRRLNEIAEASLNRTQTDSTAKVNRNVPMPNSAGLAELVGKRQVVTQRTAIVAWLAALGQEKQAAQSPAKAGAIDAMARSTRDLFLSNGCTVVATRLHFIEMARDCHKLGLGGATKLAMACASRLPKGDALSEWVEVIGAQARKAERTPLEDTWNKMSQAAQQREDSMHGPHGLLNRTNQYFHGISTSQVPQFAPLATLAQELQHQRGHSQGGNLADWQRTLTDVKAKLEPGRLDLMQQTQETETQFAALLKEHQTHAKEVTTLIRQAKEGLTANYKKSAITGVARLLDARISSSHTGHAAHEHHALLNNSRFGRHFENRLAHHLISEPPRSVVAAVQALGAAFAKHITTLPWDQEKRSLMVATLRQNIGQDDYWCKNAPVLKRLIEADGDVETGAALTDLFNGAKTSGLDCAALVHFINRIHSFDETSPWYQASQDNYDAWIRPHKSRLESRIRMEDRVTRTEGIGLLHQDDINVVAPWSFKGANPATEFKPDLQVAETSPAVAESLGKEVPYVAGGSGVMSSILHMVNHFNKHAGRRIEVGPIALATLMMLNTAHTVNEVAFTLARLDQRLGLGLNMGSGDTRAFVADYQKLLPALAGNQQDAGHVQRLMERALDDTIAEFVKTGPSALSVT